VQAGGASLAEEQRGGQRIRSVQHILETLLMVDEDGLCRAGRDRLRAHDAEPAAFGLKFQGVNVDLAGPSNRELPSGLSAIG
jgi:hypothetical protein